MGFEKLLVGGFDGIVWRGYLALRERDGQFKKSWYWEYLAIL